MDRLICTEDRNERKAEREGIKVSINKGQLVVTIALPAERLFVVTERIERAQGTPNKLRVIADELEG